MNKLQSNKDLQKEIIKVLDDKEMSIDFPTCSRLTQARFHAIDRGFLHQGNRLADIGRYAVKGVAAIYIVGITFILTMSSFEQPLLSNNEKQHHVFPLLDQRIIEDTEEDLEIYNWLYDHYG